MKKVKYIIEKSKFYGHIYDIKSEDEIKPILDAQKKLYKKACHHCYAAIINKETTFKNDGEVGYPGKTILELMKHKQLNNKLIIISRIFGGIKLGPGGVKRAFKETAKLLIE